MEEKTKFLDNLISLLQTIVERLDNLTIEIDNLKAIVNELENQQDIILENQVGHQAICGDS